MKSILIDTNKPIFEKKCKNLGDILDVETEIIHAINKNHICGGEYHIKVYWEPKDNANDQ